MFCFSLLAGRRVNSWRAIAALRMRASMSAMGSVVCMVSPARLGHARNLAAQGEEPKADPAESEITVVAARPAADAAAVEGTVGKLRRAVQLGPLACTCH